MDSGVSQLQITAQLNLGAVAGGRQSSIRNSKSQKACAAGSNPLFRVKGPQCGFAHSVSNHRRTLQARLKGRLQEHPQNMLTGKQT
jgi:hypothetical protein